MASLLYASNAFCQRGLLLYEYRLPVSLQRLQTRSNSPLPRRPLPDFPRERVMRTGGIIV